MAINQNELLSALIDGELQGGELEQALQILATDKLATAQFQRYQRATDVIQGYGEHGLSINLTDRISTALKSEAEFSVKVTNKKAELINFPKPFWKQIAGLAVAASIGALAVVGVMTQPNNSLVINTPMAAIDATNEVITIAQTGKRWTVAEPEVENRLDTYLLDHNEYTGSSGVFSYARVVSYGAE